MSTPNDNRQFLESWNQELANKDFNELVRIIAFQGKYNPEFVKMAHKRLASHQNYDENKVNALIEEIKKEPQSPTKDPANTILKVANVGCLTIKVLFWLIAILVAFFLITSDSTADNKVGALIVYVGLWGLYKFCKKLWSKYVSRKDNYTNLNP